MHRYGEIRERTSRDKNNVMCRGDVCKMGLYNRKGELLETALFDKEFLFEVSKHKWGVTHKGKCKAPYVKTDINKDGKRTVLYLHHLVVGKKDGYQVDHVSGDPLDNRKKNLRFVTQQQNLMHKTRAKGYSREKVSGLWHTYIAVDGKRINLGRFATEEEARAVRHKAEKKYLGIYAPKRGI